MKKPALPPVPKSGEDRTRFDGATKESLEIIMGRRGAAIKPLDSTATLADCIAKVNQILVLLQ